ncbi:conserved hypothetical protein [Trichinella spiralis]|uniref:hypothetical protein n=1 Tax=Trichinella spiralis TaxID=6334 RepID=UPI0001EFBE1E|nr:conserved hypothetical protein [Trichinella spiralis]
MPLFSIAPEICVASLITGSICAGFRISRTSLVVRVAISAFGEYFCRMNENAAFFGNYSLVTLKCGVFTKIRNHVDKYVITKHYYQLMPLSLATYFRIQSQLKATW